jgi:hypothetical protein
MDARDRRDQSQVPHERPGRWIGAGLCRRPVDRCAVEHGAREILEELLT